MRITREWIARKMGQKVYVVLLCSELGSTILILLAPPRGPGRLPSSSFPTVFSRQHGFLYQFVTQCDHKSGWRRVGGKDSRERCRCQRVQGPCFELPLGW